MSKLNWEYYEENICTDRPVAALFKGKKVLLEVWEGKTFHYTEPTSDLIKTCQISYAYERELTKDVTTSNSIESLNERLKAGCRKIQENYEEQIQKLKFKMENLL